MLQASSKQHLLMGQALALVKKSIWKYLEEPGSRREGGKKNPIPIYVLCLRPVN